MEKYKRTTGTKKQCVRALHELQDKCKSLKVTGFQRVNIQNTKNLGFPVQLSDETNVSDVNKVLEKRNLGPLTDFQIKNSMCYAKYKNGAISTVVVFTCARLGNPFRIAVQVEWIASLVDHEASDMIDCLKNYVANRKQKSYLFAQVAATPKAIKFWEGRLSSSQWGYVMAALFNIYDEGAHIYNQCDIRSL